MSTFVCVNRCLQFLAMKKYNCKANQYFMKLCDVNYECSHRRIVCYCWANFSEDHFVPFDKHLFDDPDPVDHCGDHFVLQRITTWDGHRPHPDNHVGHVHNVSGGNYTFHGDWIKSYIISLIKSVTCRYIFLSIVAIKIDSRALQFRYQWRHT